MAGPRRKLAVLKILFLLSFLCLSYYGVALYSNMNANANAKPSITNSAEASLLINLPPLPQMALHPESPSPPSSSPLSCPGVSPSVSRSMTYWSPSPSDGAFSPPRPPSPRYITFEPDSGGWNNIRMAMETVLAMAAATGRTIVLPPKKGMYLLQQDKRERENNKLGFGDFFHFGDIADQVTAVNFVTMEEFLRDVAGGGLPVVGDDGEETGEVAMVPGGRYDWGEVAKHDDLNEFLRKVGYVKKMQPSKSFLVFPKDPNATHESLQYLLDDPAIHQNSVPIPSIERNFLNSVLPSYISSPTPVTAPARERMREFYAGRPLMHTYTGPLASAPIIHLPVDHKGGHRLLTHFYTFLFFEDPLVDLWVKRLVRDRVRYLDELFCAAAKIVGAMEELSPGGLYDTFHVRRGDFQYKDTRVSAEEIYENTKDRIPEGSTLYIGTDEKDRSFFDPLKEHYKLYFLGDFLHLMPDLNPNYYGMIDQLVCVSGRTFFGTWFSTFTGYINRLRGYHTDRRARLQGLPRDGIVDSYYFARKEDKDKMREYWPIKNPFYSREYPVAWRDLDAA